jgi:DNA-binding NarL/FixJ family response regulator
VVLKGQQAKTEVKKVRIVIVDDHPIVRQGLAGLIENEKDLMVCGEAGDAHQAIKIIGKTQPDIAIIDILLKDSSGIELIKDIRVHYPALPLLVLSMHPESLYAERVLRAGAKGYVMKQQGTDKVILAIRKILNGQVYVSDRMASKMVRKLVGGKPEVGASPIDCLSDRELEVFLLIGQGHGTRQISERLHLSVKTIETYRSHIKEKLNLCDAAELLQYAIQWVNS